MVARGSLTGLEWLLVLLVASGGAPASAQLAGSCFDATLGPWEAIPDTHRRPSPVPAAPDQRGDSLFHAFPLRVQLTDLEPVLWGTGYQVVVPADVLPVPKSLLTWQLDGERLTIRVSDGFGGTRAELERTGDDWVGRVVTTTDMLGYQVHERSAELVEVDCQSPPPVPASADRPLLRELPLDDGPPLRLGEPLPDAYVAVAHPTRSWERIEDATPSGYWAGADAVVVDRTADGRIVRIEVRYPDDFDTGPLYAGLVAQLGPPPPSLSSWMNRSTRIFVRRGSSPKVRLLDPRLEHH